MKEWAAKLPALREVERRSGKIPGPLLNRPKLLLCNIPYWTAYCSLSKFNPISYTEMLAFSQLADLDKTELFVKVESIVEALTDKKED